MKEVDPKVLEVFTGYSENFVQRLIDVGIDVNSLYKAVGEDGLIDAVKKELESMVEVSRTAESLYIEILNRRPHSPYPAMKSEPD